MDNIERVSGTFEALALNRSLADRYTYSYIRMLDESGYMHTIKTVIVPTTVNSYISLGSKGTLYLAKIEFRLIPFTPRIKYFVAFAYSNDRIRVYDADEIKSFISVERLSGLMPLFIALVLCTLIIGIPLLPMALYFAYIKAIKIPNKVNYHKLRKYLTQYGFE